MSDATPTESMVCNGTNVERGAPSDPFASGIRPAVVSDCSPTAEEMVVAHVHGSADGLVYVDLIRYLMAEGFTHERAKRAVPNAVNNGWLRVCDGGIYRSGPRFDLPRTDWLQVIGELAPLISAVLVVAAAAFICWLVWWR